MKHPVSLSLHYNYTSKFECWPADRFDSRATWISRVSGNSSNMLKGLSAMVRAIRVISTSPEHVTCLLYSDKPVKVRRPSSSCPNASKKEVARKKGLAMLQPTSQKHDIFLATYGIFLILLFAFAASLMPGVAK